MTIPDSCIPSLSPSDEPRPWLCPNCGMEAVPHGEETRCLDCCESQTWDAIYEIALREIGPSAPGTELIHAHILALAEYREARKERIWSLCEAAIHKASAQRTVNTLAESILDVLECQEPRHGG